MSDGKFDPKRRLCPDGACIGVIGDDGRCRVCGRSASGAPAADGFAAAAESGDEAGYEDEREDEADAKDEDAKSAGAFDAKRRLCPDGSCIGVIGADGVCTVCGQKAD